MWCLTFCTWARIMQLDHACYRLLPPNTPSEILGHLLMYSNRSIITCRFGKSICWGCVCNCWSLMPLHSLISCCTVLDFSGKLCALKHKSSLLNCKKGSIGWIEMGFWILVSDETKHGCLNHILSTLLRRLSLHQSAPDRGILLVFCWMQSYLHHERFRLLNWDFPKQNKPTDKFNTSCYTNPADFEDRASAVCLFGLIYCEPCVCSVHLHIEQKWKIENIYTRSVRSAMTSLTDTNIFLTKMMSFYFTWPRAGDLLPPTPDP